MRVFELRLVLICAFSLCSTCLFAQSKSEPIDSIFILNLNKPQPKEILLNDLAKAADEQAKTIALVKLSLSPYFKPTEKRDYALDALDLSRKQNSKRGVAISHLALGAAGRNMPEIDSCLRLVKASGYQNLFLLAELNASYSIMSMSSKYVDAFRLLTHFVNNYPFRTDSVSFSRTWNMLGEVYRVVQNYPKALSCYKKSLSYSFLQGKLINASPVINIGTLHRYLGHYDSSIIYYDQAVKYVSYKNQSMEPYINFRKAQVIALQKDYAAALRLALKSMHRYDSIHHVEGQVLACSTVASIYSMLGNDAECFRYGEMAVSLGLSSGYYPEELQEVCQLMADKYQRAHQFERANHYQKVYSQVRDSIFGPAVNLKLFNEQLNLEIHNQELQNQLASEKEKVAHRAVVAQRWISISVAVVLLFFIAVSVVLYRRNKTIANLNGELKNKQDEVLAQSEELKTTNEEIEAINSNLERLVQERSQKVIEQREKLQEYSYFNAHKIRGPLARVLGLVNIMEVELTKESMVNLSRMLKQAGQDLDQSIREINQIIEDDPKSGGKIDLTDKIRK